MDLAVEGGEAVVREDDERRVVIQLAHGLREDGIELHVELLDEVGVRRILLRVVRGVRRVHAPPHGVLALVERAEVEVEQPIVELRQLVSVARQPLVEHDRRLLDELTVAEHAVLERLGVLRHVLRVEVTDRVDQFLAVALRVCDRQDLVGRVDLYGRNVQLELRMRRLEIEAREAGHCHHARHHVKLQLHPLGELALLEEDLLVADDELGDGVLRVDHHLEVDADLLVLIGHFLAGALRDLLVVLEVVRRTVDRRVDDSVHDLHRIYVASADVAPALERVRRVVRERPVGPKDVRRAHARDALDEPLRARHRREVRRALEDDARYAGRLEDLPERHASSQVERRPTREREHVVRERNGELIGNRDPQELRLLRRRHHLGRREEREVRLRRPLEEVEDAVPAWVRARYEVRPGHGALRRYAREKRAEPAPVRERLERGEFPLVYHARRDRMVHAVDAQDEHLPGRVEVTGLLDLLPDVAEGGNGLAVLRREFLLREVRGAPCERHGRDGRSDQHA